MELNERPQFTRRQMLGQSLTLASASLFVPQFIQAAAARIPQTSLALSSLAGVDQDHVLVVLQLSGGNDGLNTVVPFAMDDYYKARPGIGISRDAALRLAKNDDLGLHPAMTGIKSLYDEGLCSIVQGVGYPNPNRSHFKSMDIWHTADTSGTGTGWLGRYFDSECVGSGAGESGTAESPHTAQGQPGIAIGRDAPLAMQGRKLKPIAFESPDLFRWTGKDVHESLEMPYEALNAGHGTQDVEDHSNAAFLMRTAVDAQISSDLIRKAVARQPETQYPRTDIGRQLAMVSSMIRAGLPTRVYYVTHGGFDTHAGQGGANGNHANLLRQFSDAVSTFYADLIKSGLSERVLTMCFSEFGRRVRQNASGGTDHGTAAPMFMFGPMVKPGAYGTHPSLVDLDQGDLKFHTDFRSVYADVLEHWLSADSNVVLEGRFRSTTIVKG
ncbi:MAG: DUF1501 domain-containing protein [Phycisphaeraceae bacterium]|nr:DUF1501 domain-containing protein [Phycisphaerales bacterium]MCB9861221.1 DUF1501 domain-containing protein [Phycisphaeraceae bacterium]